MKHPNSRYRAYMKPRCSRAALSARSLSRAVALLSRTLGDAFAGAFAKQPADIPPYREWAPASVIHGAKK